MGSPLVEEENIEKELDAVREKMSALQYQIDDLNTEYNTLAEEEQRLKNLKRGEMNGS